MSQLWRSRFCFNAPLFTGKPRMPLLNVLIMVLCSWLFLLGVTAAIEHMRLRRAAHRVGYLAGNAPNKRPTARTS